MMVMAMTQNNWCKIKEDQPAAHFLWGKTNNLKYFGIVSKNGENDDRQAVQQYISLPRLIIKAEKRKMHLFSPLNVSCWVNNYSLLLFSHKVVYYSLQTHGPQHASLPCPSLSHWVCPSSGHCISDAIQPCHPLSPPSPPTFNLSQHKGLFQWVGSLYQVTKILQL